MHETGLAQQVIDACVAELRARGGCRATRVGLRIGALSAVDPEALRFCFDALKQDTPLQSALLEIEWRAATESLEDSIALELSGVRHGVGFTVVSAATRPGLHRTTLIDKMKELGTSDCAPDLRAW